MWDSNSDAPERLRSQERWAGRVATAWAVVMLATELKTIIPYVHWVVSALALLAVWPYVHPKYRSVRFPAQIPAWLFAAAICVPALYGADALYSVAEACKLAVILLGATCIFVAQPYLAHCAFRGFIIAVGINLLLFLGGYFGFGTAEEMAANRWGTVLSWPGSLSRVAGTVWVYAAYLLIKRRSPAALVLLTASTLLIYADGSRTALLLLLVAALYIVFVLAAEAGRLRRAVIVGAIGLGMVLAGVTYSGVMSEDSTLEQQGAIGRFRLLINSFEASGVEGVGMADVIRYQMLEDVVDAIQAHPLLGSGLETTITEFRTGPMSTHMSYLQVWADLGILGLIAYVWLMWGWVAWTPRVLRRIRDFSDLSRRAIYYNALYLLLLYGLAAIFHPLSTEWSEWVVFVVPYALIWRLASSAEHGRRLAFDQHSTLASRLRP